MALKLDEKMIERLHQRIGQFGQLKIGEDMRQRQRGEGMQDAIKKMVMTAMMKDREFKEGTDFEALDYGSIPSVLGATSKGADVDKLKKMMDIQKMTRESGEARSFELGAGVDPTAEEVAPYREDVLGQERFKRPVASPGGRNISFGETIQAGPEVQAGAKEGLMANVMKQIQATKARKKAGAMTYVEKEQEKAKGGYLTESKRKTLGVLRGMMKENRPMSEMKEYLDLKGYEWEDFSNQPDIAAYKPRRGFKWGR